MSETTATEETTGAESAWNPPASQDEFNRIITERLNRERSKFADYSDLKSKAQQFDQLSESQKTEAQRQADALKATETRASAAEAELARARAALKYKLADEDLDLLGTGSPEEIDARAKRLSERLAPKAPDFDGGSRKSAGAPQNMNDVIRRAAGLG
jgi:hypothetical protein